MPQVNNAWTKEQRENLGYTKEWLVEQYHGKGRSMVDIGRELHKDPKTILHWFRSYGIETRPRGFASNHQSFVKGEPSAFKGRKHTDETKERIRQLRFVDDRVPYLKNGKHWLKQDGVHSPAWKGGVTPERQALYASEKWKAAVQEVWKRDKSTCRRCGRMQTNRREDKFAVHHIYQFADNRYLRSNPDNLVLLCRDCHLFVHSKRNTSREFMTKEAVLPDWLIGTEDYENE